MTNAIHLRPKDNRVKELTEKITDIIYEYAGETGITYASIVGVLHIIAHELEHERMGLRQKLIDELYTEIMKGKFPKGVKNILLRQWLDIDQRNKYRDEKWFIDRMDTLKSDISKTKI